jgi:hypothetical protein
LRSVSLSRNVCAPQTQFGLFNQITIEFGAHCISAPEIDVCRLPRDLLASGSLASQQLDILFDTFHASYMREVRDKRTENLGRTSKPRW